MVFTRRVFPEAGSLMVLVLSMLFLNTDAYPQEGKQLNADLSSGDSVRYEIEERGSLYSLNYSLYFKGPQGYISPWHDIPLYANESAKEFNMVVEIPRWTNAKMEMTATEPLNPIKQNENKGMARFVYNIFPYHGYICNYGALPQTYLSNEYTDPETGSKGDNEPIDLVEIGSAVAKRGAVLQVKVVGCLAMIEDGEMDWKMVVIDLSDPLAAEINSMKDVERVFPGIPQATYEWFRTSKIPDGKPANEFAFGGQFKDSEFCYKVIQETHEFWKKLIAEPSPKLNTLSRVPTAAHLSTPEAASAIVSSAPPPAPNAPLPKNLDEWRFISADKL